MSFWGRQWPRVASAAVRSYGEEQPELRPFVEVAIACAGPEPQAFARIEQVLRWRPLLRRATHRSLQIAAVQALAGWPGDRGEPILQRHSGHTDPAVRAAVHEAMSRR